MPAAAITVNKSQGATLDQVTFDYDKSQQTQLVYMGLSRVTALKGLYLTNSRNDFKLYHAAVSSKEIRDEYSRLKSHTLSILTRNVQ